MDKEWESMTISAIRAALAGMEAEAQRAACAMLREDSRKGVVALAEKTLRALARAQREHERVAKLWYFEHLAYDAGYKAVIGTDEVGRGPLAGPVVAAAVVLPRDLEIIGINDSKKLTEKHREALAEEIKAKAIAWQIAEVGAETIDRMNILHAAELAMATAIEALPVGDVVLVDGTNKLDVPQPCRNIIGGDSASISIAAASIIAKVYRDHLMVEMDSCYPQYHFAQNKGYGTAEHYEALRKYGPSPIHRHSFRLS